MNKEKGNQKHLTLSDRINIEKGLINNDSFAEIGRSIRKDPTTVSKEVRRNAQIKACQPRWRRAGAEDDPGRTWRLVAQMSGDL